MGLFDTIHPAKPLVCPRCGASVRTVQSHDFGETMSDYRVGSLLTCCPVVTGIVKDTLWCDTCHEAGRPSDSLVYFVIWHSVLAGVEQDLVRAEARLSTVDRLDLIAWLHEAQQDADQWQRRYHRFFQHVSLWHEHLKRSSEDSPAGKDAASRLIPKFLRSLPDEILKAPDPLAAILASHTPPARQN